MSDKEGEEQEPKKFGKSRLVIALAVVLVCGGGGYFAGKTGVVPGIAPQHAASDDSDPHKSHDPDDHGLVLDHGAFFDLEPLVISLAPSSGHAHLRVAVTLEVDPSNLHAVEAAAPRIMDAMNTYLRAVEVSDLEKPHILYLIRSHLLARMELVLGGKYVTDVLIREFVLS